jgi:excisionase family DNA binding protein
MVEDEYVSIQEAARRCGVSGKTIQRAIQAGKLPAQYPKPNQCKIAISALVHERRNKSVLKWEEKDQIEEENAEASYQSSPQ